jgi:tetratricopeptide (TPR) repeat protein
MDLYQAAKHIEDYDEAAQSITIAITLQPSNPRYYFSRANCLRAMGEHHRAIMDYTSAIRLEDDTAQFYHNRATCLRKLGQIQVHGGCH